VVIEKYRKDSDISTTLETKTTGKIERKFINWECSPPFGRRKSLICTLELLHDRRTDHPPLIVEIGTSESYNPDGLGNALLAFAWYVGEHGGRVKSVDVAEGSVLNSRKILHQYAAQYAELPEIIWADAYEWVATLDEPIDLLYVDAGFEIIGDLNYRAFVKRHPEIPSFYVELFCQFQSKCFRSGSLLLIDDTDPFTWEGKGVFLIPYLLKNGWRELPLDGEPVFPMVLLEKI
jgi:hypothetical protein